jgi:hypothetical protein
MQSMQRVYASDARQKAKGQEWRRIADGRQIARARSGGQCMATKQLARGIYETTYGNTAYVSGPKAKTAYDLDMAERIPISEVNPDKWVRDANDCDEPCDE